MCSGFEVLQRGWMSEEKPEHQERIEKDAGMIVDTCGLMGERKEDVRDG